MRGKPFTTHEEYLQKLQHRHIPTKPLEEYMGSITKIDHLCVCGRVWKVTPASVLNHGSCGCTMTSVGKERFWAAIELLRAADRKKVTWIQAKYDFVDDTHAAMGVFLQKYNAHQTDNRKWVCMDLEFDQFILIQYSHGRFNVDYALKMLGNESYKYITPIVRRKGLKEAQRAIKALAKEYEFPRRRKKKEKQT